MAMTDPIADMLTRIRNGLVARRDTVDMPTAKIKVEIAKILKDEGYIENSKVIEKEPQSILRVHLKYTGTGEKVISGLERVSRPGRRVYCGKDEIPKVLGGMGVAILSTPMGLQTGASCRKLGVGGEVLCSVW